MDYINHYDSPLGGITLASDGTALTGLWFDDQKYFGDTLTEGEKLHFRGLPSFSPELFKYIENDDPMKSKQLQKGIDQLMD